MGAEEKRRVDVPALRMNDWRKAIYHWVVILVAAVILYWAGVTLRIWEHIFFSDADSRIVSGLLVSFLATLFLYNLYTQVMSRLLIKPHFDGLKCLQTEDYDEAIKAFEQLYDLFDRHPRRARLYTLLLLNMNSVDPRELALLNQAYAYIQQGSGPDVIRCYEQCLALNPNNAMVTSSLNLAAAVSGGEIRPMPGHVAYRAYVKRKQRSQPRWQGCLYTGIVVSLAFCCSVPILMGMASGSFRWYDGLILLGLVGSLAIVTLLIRMIRWIISQFVLMDFYRGERLLRKQQYREAIQAFRQQADFIEESPWVDDLRGLLLTPSGEYGYQEWSLLRMAYGYIQLGEGERLLPIYEQVLALNPQNGLARSNINFINLFRGDE